MPEARNQSGRARSPRSSGPRARGRLAARFVQWSALAALVLSLVVWGWLILRGAGEIATAVLADDPGDSPVEVLAAPRVIEPGRALAPEAVERELRSLGYRAVGRVPHDPGEYHLVAGALDLFRRRHVGPAGEVPEAAVHVTLDGGRVLGIEAANGRQLQAFAMEPVRLGAFRGPMLEERRPLPLARFPRRLVEAVMSAEDSRFLAHHGIDPRGVIRAIWTDLRGGQLQGGSTITQQVIKNRVVGRDRTLLRKAHEAVLAAYVEGKVSKERLLEIYLNEIYLGQRGSVSVVGMPAAALHYFGRNVADLSLNQVAMLAGMIASPGRFDPRNNPDAARERMKWVLSRMVELGYIDQATAAAAGDAPFGIAPLEDPLDPAGDVIDAVRRDVEARGYEPRPSRERAGIFTSLDVELQAAARRALDESLAELEEKEPERRPLDGAVVIMRPATGEILALVGGRNGTRGGFHRALDARRQPGSAFKPFVALAAFATGQFQPGSVVDDAPLVVPTTHGTWSPENYDHAYRGPVTVRQAIENSLNVPMARVGLAVHPQTIVEWAQRAGLKGHLPAQPSIALGAVEVAPIDLATAYVTLAAMGQRRAPVLVKSVRTGLGGEPVALAPIPGAPPELPSDACWMVLDCMAGVIERGTGKDLLGVTGGVRVAGKTGTTQDGRDAWFVLVTGQAVVVVYVGRDDDRPAHLTGAGSALPVVKRLLVAAGPRLLAPLPGMPEGLKVIEIDPETGGVATSRCPTRVAEVFRPGTEPPTCRKHASALRRLWDRITGKGKDSSGGGGRKPSPGRR